ncbi:putative disease resistance protein RGA3 [Hordeum vulgare]|nr:putative disease resistance protein RGA3 [Hordeum vulgare]
MDSHTWRSSFGVMVASMAEAPAKAGTSICSEDEPVEDDGGDTCECVKPVCAPDTILKQEHKDRSRSISITDPEAHKEVQVWLDLHRLKARSSTAVSPSHSHLKAVWIYTDYNPARTPQFEDAIQLLVSNKKLAHYQPYPWLHESSGSP